jgi:hypothetical protein
MTKMLKKRKGQTINPVALAKRLANKSCAFGSMNEIADAVATPAEKRTERQHTLVASVRNAAITKT